ncbi:3-ketoacyl-ACP reductase [Tessaracoccus rhinocerotis]|uniref:3-ketoacyl-ACP reductase n=1 Tax=Tessaracoccus rhinocerotis TaxID=1689449 RepID=A0A553K0M7_9ACTN|nr:3-ketoacyl-ACP reductase [Tessaracoccus rhinocerotis]TRY18245.1 3-ketoacyl-ACP reductase [Tessaracoccus rhinocerotis]
MNRVAIVTGGSRGIGLGISQSLIAEGVRVAVVATRPEPEGLVDSLGGAEHAAYFRATVDDVDSHAALVADVVARFGRIDVLINNAGVGPTERLDILEATPESYDRVMGINLRGPYFLTQAVANQMLGQEQLEGAPRGVIVNVSSISATTVSTNRGEYCISKAGVSMATRLWAARLAPEGILAYEVRPGIIATDMTAGVKDRYDALFAQGISPMPRWGQPSDVGGAVAALASGAMPYSTGDVINVDGGMHLPRL